MVRLPGKMKQPLNPPWVLHGEFSIAPSLTSRNNSWKTIQSSFSKKEVPLKNEIKEKRKAETNSRCPFYLGVRLNVSLRMSQI